MRLLAARLASPNAIALVATILGEHQADDPIVAHVLRSESCLFLVLGFSHLNGARRFCDMVLSILVLMMSYIHFM